MGVSNDLETDSVRWLIFGPRFDSLKGMRWVGSFLGLCLLATPSWAWWAEGHQTVALMAEHRMPAKTRAYAASILRHHPDPGVRGLTAASVWPDQVRDQPEFHHGSWHYLNLPIWLDVAERPIVVQGDIERALNACTRVLKDPRASRRDKAIALSWTVHLIGDIHQPLHAATGYSSELPEGDRGGGLREVRLGQSPVKLHAFWDSAGGLFWAGANRERLGTIVDGLAQRYPVEESSLAVLSPRAWAEESHRLAGEVVYEGIGPGQPLSQAYIERARDVSQGRMALAGYRLAAYLERLQESVSAP